MAQVQKNQGQRKRTRTAAQRDGPRTEAQEESKETSRRRLRSRSSGAGRSATSQQERVCVALRVQISNVTLECGLWTTTSAEIAFAREGFTERAQNDQRVLVGVVHRHSTRSECRVRSGEVGKEGEGLSGSIWQRGWATCSLCPLPGYARRQIEVSSAVYALPRAEVRSAPGMRPGTAISAAW